MGIFVIDINYEIEERLKDIVQFIIIVKNFIKFSNIALILGDNLFHGKTLINT